MSTVVTKFGKVVSPAFEKESEAFGWLLHHQGQSVSYATTYGGYAFKEVPAAFRKVLNPGKVHGIRRRPVDLYVNVEFDGVGLSMTGVEGPLSNGDAAGGVGQIDMHMDADYIDNQLELDPKSWTKAAFLKLLEVWDEWHLNDMTAGTPAQESWLKEHRTKVSYPESQYERDSADLAEAGLNPDLLDGEPYKYGSRWLTKEVPADVLDWLRGLPESTKEPAWGVKVASHRERLLR